MLFEPPVTRWDLNWRMFGVPVRVHPLFWLMALLLSWSKGIPPLIVIESMAIIFISILVHEFGHALSGRYYGDRRNHVVLYMMGGLCVQSERPPLHFARILILL